MSDPIHSFLTQKFHESIKKIHTVEPKKGEYSFFPESLHPDICKALKESGIEQLYSHQEKAFSHISKDKDTVIVSQTASGKTMSFFLPILNEYIYSKSPFSVLLLYPTKALSRDQEGTLSKLMKIALGKTDIGTFDGDTPREQRSKLAQSSDFIITNPDMLHGGILPNHHRRWKSFLSRLRYIVVDEVHNYRGAYGSHVANIFRRLERVCELHGSKPTYICSSATIANPKEHAEALFNRSFETVDRDGSPRSKRNIYFINPPLYQNTVGSWYRKGPGSVSVPLIRELAQKGIRTICFCRARQEVERLYKAVMDRYGDLKNIVKPYRGGLLPTERRQLEKKFFEGSVKVIISTNALELGIDIGDLDCCILSGHPGSLSSFWQQAGRAGRKNNDASIVFIAKETAIDQYLVHHPEFLFETPIEQAWLNANNPYILLQHLPCAAHENPLNKIEDKNYQKDIYQFSLETLKSDGTITSYLDSYRYALSDYPARGVNIRGMTDYNIEIVCDEKVIGELDPIGARGTLYKDAIYQHLGKRYMSLDLDLEKKICTVTPIEVDYYTEAVWENRVELTEVDEEKEVHEHKLSFGYIHANQQPKLYKKIKERSFENIGYGPITLNAFEYDTTGFSYKNSKNWTEKMEAIDKRYIHAANYGLSYILKRTAPSVCMADSNDLQTDVSLSKTESWESAVYLYDSIEGGVGYSEKVFDQFEQVMKMSLAILTECECQSGCPACVPSLPPGVDPEDMSDILIESNCTVECTKSLITHFLDNKWVEPNIAYFKTKVEEVEQTQESPELIKLKRRLNKAADILREKKKKLH